MQIMSKRNIEKSFLILATKCVVGILNIHYGCYQFLWHIPNRTIACRQIGIYIVNDSMTDIMVSLQHVEEHGSSTHKGFNVGNILPSVEVCRQLRIQLFYELGLSANPLDKGFCFCSFR